jgi:hypothetical protein
MAVSGGEADGQDRWIGNFGLGQRWFPAAKDEEDAGDWMIGYNAFFDNDFTRSHQRGGVGVELQYDWLHLASNYYFPLSDWKDSYDFDSRLVEERPAEGWDARVKAWLPFYRNVALTGAYTQWYGDRVGMFGHSELEKDPRVWSYGVEYTPVPLVSGFLTQRSTERGRTETEYGLNFTYHFGMSWDEQVTHSKVAELRTVSGSRHEFVDRENRIILEYRAKDAYRIEYVGTGGLGIFVFRLRNGFDEVAAGVTATVTAGPGVVLAPSGTVQSYTTDGDGRFRVAVASATSPFTLTIRAGGNEQTFTLSGNVVPYNGLLVNFNKTQGEDFVTTGGYQSTVQMTAVRMVNGVETALSSGEQVTWSVTSSISGLSTGANGVWKRNTTALNGLSWGATADSTSYSSGFSSWSSNSIAGTAPPSTDHTVNLTDVVGSRTITVKVTVAGETSSGSSFTFGKGPLSVFTEFSTNGNTVWATTHNNNDFQALDNTDPGSFPAATFCKGSVKNNVTATGPATSTDAGFTPNDGGWDPDARPSPDSGNAGRYANTSGMATGEQLLAVAVYNSGYNNSGKAADRKGAAAAAGWLVNNAFVHSWTGEAAYYYTGSWGFVAYRVMFDDGRTGWYWVDGGYSVVCRRDNL